MMGAESELMSALVALALEKFKSRNLLFYAQGHFLLFT